MTKPAATRQDLNTLILGSSALSEVRGAALAAYDRQLSDLDARIAALTEVEACRAHEAKMLAERTAVESCISPEWRIAQGHYAQAVQATAAAFDHCYAIGALPKPHWA